MSFVDERVVKHSEAGDNTRPRDGSKVADVPMWAEMRKLSVTTTINEAFNTCEGKRFPGLAGFHTRESVMAGGRETRSLTASFVRDRKKDRNTQS
jgi:hypothetical protein